MILRVYRWLGAKVKDLSELKDSPHSVAIGIACGVFFGFIPLIGFKTLLAIGSARLAKGNMMAATIAVTLHDVILPIAPILLRWEYQIGHWFMNQPQHLPPDIHGLHQGALIWFHWGTLFSVGLPLVIGSIVVAAPMSVLSYFVSLRLYKRRAETALKGS